jgi:hypothetical protein
VQNAIEQWADQKMRSEGCWPADGMIAAASPYWEFGTSRWQLEEQDISAKADNRCTLFLQEPYVRYLFRRRLNYSAQLRKSIYNRAVRSVATKLALLPF